MATKKETSKAYNDQSIKALKGADRVRKRPGVIFGSDGLEGCEHSFFEILSNSVDEAREGHGNNITVTAFADKSICVDDRGRGVPLGYNKKEDRFFIRPLGYITLYFIQFIFYPTIENLRLSVCFTYLL